MVCLGMTTLVAPDASFGVWLLLLADKKPRIEFGMAEIDGLNKNIPGPTKYSVKKRIKTKSKSKSLHLGRIKGRMGIRMAHMRFCCAAQLQ